MIGNSDIGIIIGSCEKQANAGPESQEISEKKNKKEVVDRTTTLDRC